MGENQDFLRNPKTFGESEAAAFGSESWQMMERVDVKTGHPRRADYGTNGFENAPRAQSCIVLVRNVAVTGEEKDYCRTLKLGTNERNGSFSVFGQRSSEYDTHTKACEALEAG